MKMDIEKTVYANQYGDVLCGSMSRETSSEVHLLNSHWLEIKHSEEEVTSYAFRLFLAASTIQTVRSFASPHIQDPHMAECNRNFYADTLLRVHERSTVSKRW